jgi:hypothetical protein
MLRQVSENGLRLTTSSGNRRRRRRDAAAAQVAEDRDHQAGDGHPGRMPRAPASRPPASVPIRMATKGAGLDQRVAADQFTFAQVLRQDRVLDRPEQRRMQAEQKQRREQNRQAVQREAEQATPMMTISSSFTRRASFALSYLSASWPAVAENRKKGRMKIPAARLVSTSGASVVQLAA